MASTRRPSEPSAPHGRLLPAVIGWLCFVSFALSAWNPADASRPVARTLTGCVIDGTFYSISVDPDTGRPDKAYPTRTGDGVDLSRYEGKTIILDGFLSPGDRFSVKAGIRPVVKSKTCGADERKAIGRESLVARVINAHRAALRGDFAEAYRQVDRALTIDRSDCQTYIDRAYIHYLRGDFPAGDRDVHLVMNRQCPDMKRINFLILLDTAKVLLRHGKRAEAERIYRFAFDTCGSEICRDAVKREMESLKSSGPDK